MPEDLSSVRGVKLVGMTGVFTLLRVVTGPVLLGCLAQRTVQRCHLHPASSFSSHMARPDTTL
jgi:hypothetical protein